MAHRFWQAFLRIVVPIAAPGFVAAFILSLVFSWNEYFFAVVLAGADAPTLPLLLAGQTSSQGTRWWSIAALATAAITPLIIIGLIMERHIVKGLDGRSRQVDSEPTSSKMPKSVITLITRTNRFRSGWP